MGYVAANVVLGFGHVTKPQDGVDLGNVHRSQVLTNLNNISRKVTANKGGGTDETTNVVMAKPAVSIINPGGRNALEFAFHATKEASGHSAEDNVDPTAPMKVLENIYLVQSKA